MILQSGMILHPWSTSVEGICLLCIGFMFHTPELILVKLTTWLHPSVLSKSKIGSYGLIYARLNTHAPKLACKMEIINLLYDDNCYLKR
jgi:hypothetical protein